MQENLNPHETLYSEPLEKLQHTAEELNELADFLEVLRQDKENAQNTLDENPELGQEIKNDLVSFISLAKQSIDMYESQGQDLVLELDKLKHQHEIYTQILEKFKPTIYH
jgi:chromosome segregation ATPase